MNFKAKDIKIEGLPQGQGGPIDGEIVGIGYYEENRVKIDLEYVDLYYRDELICTGDELRDLIVKMRDKELMGDDT